jgi:hypothetical protein
MASRLDKLVTAFYKEGLMRDLTALVPFLAVISLDALERNIRTNIISFLVILLVVSAILLKTGLTPRNILTTTDSWHREYSQIKEVLENTREPGEEIVLMVLKKGAFDPYNIHYTTRYKVVRIPSEGLNTIYELAQKYKGNYMVFRAVF